MKVERNDPCPCGSGKKYKKCCLNKDRELSKDSSRFDAKNINNPSKSGKISDNQSFQEMKKSIEGMKAIKAAAEAGLLNGLIPFGLDIDALNDTLSEVSGFEEKFNLMVNVPDKFNEHFSKLGWIAHESMNSRIMQETVELAEKGQTDKAEEILIGYYSENLELFIRWVNWMDEFIDRINLLQNAYEDYLAERYHSCIPLVFSIIDGAVADTKEIEGNKIFFAAGEEIYAWDSIAAHQTGLTELRRLLYQNRGKTTTDELDIPFRNGIIHGRDLGYANKKVATKTWATLFALKDGIISIKRKGKEPKEESDKIDFMKTMKLVKENETRENLLKEWEPRKLKVGIDFPESGDHSDYPDGSPEKSLVEFYEYWKDGNFGYMAQKLDHRRLKETTIGKIAGKFSREIFNNKKLNSFKILNIIDEAPAISEIRTEIVIEKEDELITKEISFRMIYEDENGEIEIRTMNNGSWKFIGCFNDIDDI